MRIIISVSLELLTIQRETLPFHMMSKVTATIREIRTDFRSVKRKIEAHGEVVITDNGVPSFLLKALPPEVKQRNPLPDYYSRLQEQQPVALTAEQTRKLLDENRGER